MQRTNGWIGRTVQALRALFGGVAAVEVAPAVSVEPPSVAPQPMMRQPAPRLLAARLAVQAKLNVPVGKKARIAPLTSAKTATRRPVDTGVIKRSPKARSVFLQARHVAAKSTPKPNAIVVAMPVAKVMRPAVKPVSARPYRIAA